MWIFRLKNLVLSSVLTIFVAGCSFPQFKSFQPATIASFNLNTIKPWFTEGTDRFLFHAEIDIYRNHFGGIMVVKYLKPESYRVIFITEVGLKVFDLEFFRNGDFKKHYCMDAINRKIVIKTLKNDIGLMLENIPQNNKTKYLHDSHGDKTLLKTVHFNEIKYYLLNNTTDRIEEITTRSRLQKKMEILYFSNKWGELDSLRIRHYNIKLKIQLTRLNETR